MNPTYDFHDRVAVEVGARGRAMFSSSSLKPYSSVLSHLQRSLLPPGARRNIKLQ